MNKQSKKLVPSDLQVPLHTPSKISPFKQRFITFQSDYDYGENYNPLPYLVKNPKWCHLQLKLGHTGALEQYKQLRRAKSLRLRSLHLESFSLDSQACGDQINGYFGELDTLTRAGHTLKNLSLSVTLDDDDTVKKYRKQDAYHRLEKFVKKQKYLDEFAFYNGTSGTPQRLTNWLGYLEQTLKVLTVENLTVDDLFKRYTFPKLEVLRFEYILFDESERSFDLSVVMRCFEQIFSLRHLQALKFVQYHRYDTIAYYDSESDENEEDEAGNDEEALFPSFSFSFSEFEEEKEDEMKMNEDKGENDGENGSGDPKKYDITKIKEFPIKFWEVLRESLDVNKKKQLKVKYHKQDEAEEEKMKKVFGRVFRGLSEGQIFEYEVREIEPVSTGYGWMSKTKNLSSYIFV